MRRRRKLLLITDALVVIVTALAWRTKTTRAPATLELTFLGYTNKHG